MEKNRMLQGYNAIITGARRGIGRETVKFFAECGANVWACARKQDDAFEADMRSIASNNGVNIWPVYFDVTNETQVKEAIRLVKGAHTKVDVLVNAAGIADDSTSFHMTSINKMEHVMETNFYSVTMLIQYVSRIMMRQKSGSIVNISSVAGIDGMPAQYEYVASKAAVIGGTRCLARELAPYGVRVNAVAPGIVETDMGNQIDEKLKEQVLNNVIMQRAAGPHEIASVIGFLASDMASYITGQIIRVDGGM